MPRDRNELPRLQVAGYHPARVTRRLSRIQANSNLIGRPGFLFVKVSGFPLPCFYPAPIEFARPFTICEKVGIGYPQGGWHSPTHHKNKFSLVFSNKLHTKKKEMKRKIRNINHKL
jgi:hypothetical protein